MISSQDLRIGDLVEFEANDIILADILLLEGQCIVSEALLTGESVPVNKNLFAKNNPISASNILYSGTKCLFVKNKEKDKALGLVVNTGFYTFKGKLVRELNLR